MRRLLCVLIAGAMALAAGCVPPPVPPTTGTVLAVAYTNVDGIDGFDEATDVLIAKLADSNDDGVVSIGDTVTTAQYPEDFAGAQFGDFTATSHVINTVEDATSTVITVSIDQFAFFVFRDNPSFESFADHYFVLDNTAIVDGFDTQGDVIQIRPTSPSAPDSELTLDRLNTTDDDFIDVDISIP